MFNLMYEHFHKDVLFAIKYTLATVAFGDKKNLIVLKKTCSPIVSSNFATLDSSAHNHGSFLANEYEVCFTWLNDGESSFFSVNITSQLQSAINIIIKVIYHMVEASYSSELVLSAAPSGANWIGV